MRLNTPGPARCLVSSLVYCTPRHTPTTHLKKFRYKQSLSTTHIQQPMPSWRHLTGEPVFTNYLLSVSYTHKKNQSPAQTQFLWLRWMASGICDLKWKENMCSIVTDNYEGRQQITVLLAVEIPDTFISQYRYLQRSFMLITTLKS